MQHVEVARRLLDSGADPTAGYLWEGLPSPYTALTGALSSAHSQPIDLARLLLERGADANDSQALYELGSAADDDTDALELLYEFGLGTGTGGIWHTRLAPLHPTPSQLVEDELIKAAAWNRPRRAQVVLRNPVDLGGRGTDHPMFEGRTAYPIPSSSFSARACSRTAGSSNGSGRTTRRSLPVRSSGARTRSVSPPTGTGPTP